VQLRQNILFWTKYRRVAVQLLIARVAKTSIEYTAIPVLRF
jgi:hypothetical protein